MQKLTNLESRINMTRYPVPGTRYPLPDTRYPVPGTRYPIPTTRYPLPGTRYPVPATRYPLPGTRYPLPGTRYPVPATRTRVFHHAILPRDFILRYSLKHNNHVTARKETYKISNYKLSPHEFSCG